MTITEHTGTGQAPSQSLAERAIAAHRVRQEERNEAKREEHVRQVAAIWAVLADKNIAAAGKPFVNRASGNVCVPLIPGGFRTEPGPDSEEPDFVYAVAAEWAHGEDLRLVATEFGECSTTALFPAGYLTELADIGHALENGGRRPAPKMPPAAAQIERVLQRGLTSEYLDEHDNAILTAAEAVCAALADIADAIRDGHGL